jgi:hypothetical protein
MENIDEFTKGIGIDKALIRATVAVLTALARRIITLDIAENIIQALYISPAQAETLKKRIPPRAKPA